MKILFAIALTTSLLYSAEEIVPFQPTLQQTPISISQLEPPAPFLPPSRKNPFIAVGLSYFVPGLGHAYLGDVKTASCLIGSTGVGLGLGLVGYGHGNSQVYSSSSITVQSIYSYGIYAAYRDVRKYNGGSYSYKMPTDSFLDLSFASFKPSILKKPEVWGGFLGALTLAITTTYFAYPDDAHIKTPAASSRGSLYPPVAFSVGVGEEAFFRGYLQSMLSEALNPTAGLVLSSLAFGAAHISNASHMESDDQRRYYTYSIPFITVLGAYFGWLTQKNHSLQESVALHSWYDFTLFALSAATNQAACTGKPGFAFAIPF